MHGIVYNFFICLLVFFIALNIFVVSVRFSMSMRYPFPGCVVYVDYIESMFIVLNMYFVCDCCMCV